MTAVREELEKQLRAANFKAAEASRKWDERKAELTAYIASMYGTKMQYSPQAERDKHGGDWQLNDYYAQWNFWQQEAQRVGNYIMALLSLGRL